MTLRLARAAIATLLLLWQLPADALESVTLQLKWQHPFQFVGYYMAQEKGYYRNAGLDVTLRPNGYNGSFTSPVTAVISGDAQYGISNSGLIRDFADGKPVVALAATLQHSAVIWLTLERSDMRNLHDLIGKKLMTVFPLSESVELLAPFTEEGISLNQLNLVPTTFDLQALIKGEVDAYDAYVTNEPFQLEQLGIPYRLIDPRAYGIDFYGDVLFTSRNELLRHPEWVRNFRLASLQGWRYAMDHVDETIRLIRSKYAPEKSEAQLKFEAIAMARLMETDFVDVGHMNPGRWQRIAEIQMDKDRASRLDYPEFIYTEERLDSFIANYLHILVAVSSLVVLLSGAILFYHRLNRRLRDEIEARIRAESQLRELSETDPLTGLHNLRYMMTQLEMELNQFQRYGRPFCLLMFDLDHFKRINDKWGHPAGDMVLTEFANRLRANTRQTDAVARTGGEEFLLLLREVDFKQAKLIAENLRKQIAATPFPLPGEGHYPVTVSIGIAAMRHSISQIKDLLSEADQALYHAKNRGRNRVSLFEPDEPLPTTVKPE